MFGSTMSTQISSKLWSEPIFRLLSTSPITSSSQTNHPTPLPFSWIKRNVTAFYLATPILCDAAYFSMKNLNFTDVVVLVTETGWPSKGDSKEPYATKDNADTYNSNLIKHVYDRSGTPLHPETTSSVYIYELFNEDLRSPPVSEANWGLFYGNTTPAYLLHVSGIGSFLANDTTNQTYCVAMDGIDSKTLQAALDWACGPRRANCS